MKKIIILLVAAATLITVSCKKHEHEFVKHDAVPATYTEAGAKEYYECVGTVLPCGNFFEDALGQVLIGGPTELAAWVAEGGAGYVPVLTTLSYGGVDYKVAVMADGNVWMAENLRYVPAGKTVAELTDDYTSVTCDGIYYPATYEVVDGAAVVTPSNDPAVVAAQGLLYTAAAAMNGATIPTEDWADCANTQGICPEGWHIPTAQEWVNLVGACAAKTHNNVEAPYYNADLSGADLAKLNEDGFNFLPFPYLNQGKTYLGSYLNKRADSEYNVYASMFYFQSSTGRSATQNYAGMITNNNTKTSVNCAYNTLTNGCAVRCVKNADPVK